MLITEKDVKFKASRSSGPGGQKLNRRSTKVQLWVKIDDLPLNERDKKKIRQRLSHHINHKDELWVYDQEERFQKLNKDKALARLNQMIEEALKEPPPRLQTEPSFLTRKIRIKEKKIKSQKKRGRRII